MEVLSTIHIVTPVQQLLESLWACGSADDSFFALAGEIFALAPDCLKDESKVVPKKRFNGIGFDGTR